METNYFADLFLAISSYLKTAIPEVRFIDADLGQLDNYELRPAVTFPCILIDFAQATYTDLGHPSQLGEVVISIRLAVSPFSASNILAPLSVREKAVSYFTIEQKIFIALSGFYTAYTTPLSRTAVSTELRQDDTIRVRNITFTTSYQDDTAQPNRTAYAAPLDLEIEN
jgi:hypothetical protein